MAQISFYLDSNDPHDLAETRDFCDYLLMHHMNAPAMPSESSTQGRIDVGPKPRVARSSEPGNTDTLATTAVDDLWSRTGLSLRQLVKVVAELPEDPFSLKDLADSLGQDMSAAKSRWANLGRSIKAMREAVPGAPPIVEEVDRREGLWHFRMPEAVREAVLLKELEEPYSDGSLPT